MKNDLDAAKRRVLEDIVLAESPDAPPKPADFVIIDNTYRLVKPYYFDFLCCIKRRWVGGSVVDVFAREFPARDRQYYTHAVQTGRLRKERGDVLHPDSVLKEGDRMRHIIHRHEPPVPAVDVRVLGTAGDIVAVSKPAGMPVHASGQYRKNTVLGILQANRPDLFPLLPVHRLDKPVSGVLLLARNAKAADSLRQGIADKGDVRKTYVARVEGVFPETKDDDDVVVVNVALGWDPVSGSAFPVLQDSLDIQPHIFPGNEDVPNVPEFDTIATNAMESIPLTKRQIRKQQRKLQRKRMKLQKRTEGGGILGGEAGIANMSCNSQSDNRKSTRDQSELPHVTDYNALLNKKCVPDACPELQKSKSKPATTAFKLIAVAPDRATSLVECRPLTGRSHQIRAHLAWLGHPIANDGQYGGHYYGPQGTRNMALRMGIAWDHGGSIGVVDPQTKRLEACFDTEKSNTDARRMIDAFVDDTNDARASESSGTNGASKCEGNQYDIDDGMHQFNASSKFKIADSHRDALCPHCPFYAPHNYPVDMGALWLHALKYSCSQWSFEDAVPAWADVTFVPQNISTSDR